MKEKVTACFDTLQELDIKPTPHNVSILAGVYELLRQVFEELNKEGDTVASDSE